MKSLRLLMCVMPLALAGCSTISSVNWSAANPWNWFGSSGEVTEQGVAGITSATPLKEEDISEALGSSYHLRSGMKTDNGNIVRFFEAMKDNKVALVINGDSGTVSQIDIQDPDIKTADGGEIGSVFSDLYKKAYGSCQKASGDHAGDVECKAEGSQHISYLFTGEWSGPADLMPSDDTLKSWKVSKIIWRR
ncbi:RpoE-regulated lipoprotein [Superficieibacter sp. 1612_C1]|uniref:RpoE-regulated lipoprotein n=1 Tax=Superficieibacter sp. 1612_C1 TaxID=2780382 RepID=UPI0015A4271F|nr:RpoE-regulated lipoprotein [Superficieibacter sp. 1612_C1]MDU2939860.1 RpoE-regulated lipoprotein [Enterobacteriaceae bacterium]